MWWRLPVAEGMTTCSWFTHWYEAAPDGMSVTAATVVPGVATG
jgi:hypothetical protein